MYAKAARRKRTSVGPSSHDAVHKTACLLEKCGLTTQLAGPLTSAATPELRAFLDDPTASCDALKQGKINRLCETLADAVEQLDLHTLASVGVQLCQGIEAAQTRIKHPVLSREHRQRIQNILLSLGHNPDDFQTDSQRCQAISSTYSAVAHDVERLTAIISHQRAPQNGAPSVYSKLKRGILALVTAYALIAAAPVASCGATASGLGVTTTSLPAPQSVWARSPPEQAFFVSPQPAQCRTEFDSIDDLRRHWVIGDVWPDVAKLAADPAVVDPIREHIFTHPRPGRQTMPPTLTFVLGAAGAGKGTVFHETVQRFPLLARGIRGALTVNTDDIMEQLPGYTTMTNLGVQEGVNISAKDAAAIYHAPAEDIGLDILREARDTRQSIIFDGTGNDLSKLQNTMRTFKSLGYSINMVIVTAPRTVRHRRVHARAIRTGRYVPPDVVERGRSSVEWHTFVQEALDVGMLDIAEIVDNV